MMSAKQHTRDSFLDTLLGQAAAIAAMVAGTVGLLYASGGAVMWLRVQVPIDNGEVWPEFDKGDIRCAAGGAPHPEAASGFAEAREEDEEEGRPVEVRHDPAG